VSRDPFQPDRRAPAQRYVLPGQRSVFAEVETEPTPAPSFRVVGSARIGRGGLALVQVDDGEMPIAVSVGESIEGYRLVSVTEEGATLMADGDSWVLSVVEPAEERRSNNNRGNNNNRSNNNRGGNNNDQAVERAVQERVQQMIQQGLQIFGGVGGRIGGRGGGAGVVIRGGRGGGPQ
jgi:hypothetical protein